MKKITLFGLHMMMVFSSFAMDMTCYSCPMEFQLFDGEIDNLFSIDQEKLAFLVRNNNKPIKERPRITINRQPQKQSGRVTRASFKNIVNIFNTRIAEDKFDEVSAMLEEHSQLQEDCVLAAKFMDVRLGAITSVQHFYQGLTVIPVNAGKIAKEFARAGDNERFLQSWDCHQRRTAVLDI